MIRRLVDWCVPDKALRLGTRHRTMLLQIAALPAYDGERLRREFAEAFTTIGAAATTAGTSLVNFTIRGDVGDYVDVSRRVRAELDRIGKRNVRYPRPLRAAGR